MVELDIAIDEDAWPQQEVLEALARRAIDAAVAAQDLNLPAASEVSLLFTNDEHIRNLNLGWRDRDKATNVLSFANNDAGKAFSALLGDIVLAQETIAREANEQDKTFDDHLTHLIIHGFLHLLGYDHLEDDEAEAMEKLEISVLRGLGIADPYVPA